MWSNYFSAPTVTGMCCRCPYLHYCSSMRSSRQKEFTIDELAQYDGSGGKPAYVAVAGIVYDVSMNPAWGGGSHFGLIAGKDLTAQFEGCHKMNTVLAKLPKVGVLK